MTNKEWLLCAIDMAGYDGVSLRQLEVIMFLIYHDSPIYLRGEGSKDTLPELNFRPGLLGPISYDLRDMLRILVDKKLIQTKMLYEGDTVLLYTMLYFVTNAGHHRALGIRGRYLARTFTVRTLEITFPITWLTKFRIVLKEVQSQQFLKVIKALSHKYPNFASPLFSVN